MATLTVTDVVEAGNDMTVAGAACAAGGDVFPNAGDVFIRVRNAGGSPQTVTATPPNASVQKEGFGALARATIAVSIPATTGDKIIGPFPPAAFNNGSGQVALTYTAVTSLTINVFRLPRA